MNTTNVQSLFDYNYWVNQRILDAAAGLSAEKFAAPADVSHGSLRGTLVHALGAEWAWRLRCQGTSPSALLSADDFHDLASLRGRWDEEEQEMRKYLAGLTDEALAGNIEYTRTEGTHFKTPLWQILLHVINHGTQSRSEAAVLLTQYGHSPGDLDYMVFLR
jgi:uncharacterized damage-inducible protein DinB